MTDLEEMSVKLDKMRKRNGRVRIEFKLLVEKICELTQEVSLNSQEIDKLWQRLRRLRAEVRRNRP